MVADVAPARRRRSVASTPASSRRRTTKSPRMSSPIAPTFRTSMPSFARSTLVPAAVPAAVARISSMRIERCPADRGDGRPRMSRIWTPRQTTEPSPLRSLTVLRLRAPARRSDGDGPRPPLRPIRPRREFAVRRSSERVDRPWPTTLGVAHARTPAAAWRPGHRPVVLQDRGVATGHDRDRTFGQTLRAEADIVNHCTEPRDRRSRSERREVPTVKAREPRLQRSACAQQRERRTAVDARVHGPFRDTVALPESFSPSRIPRRRPQARSRDREFHSD